MPASKSTSLFGDSDDESDDGSDDLFSMVSDKSKKGNKNSNAELDIDAFVSIVPQKLNVYPAQFIFAAFAVFLRTVQVYQCQLNFRFWHRSLRLIAQNGWPLSHRHCHCIAGLQPVISFATQVCSNFFRFEGECQMVNVIMRLSRSMIQLIALS